MSYKKILTLTIILTCLLAVSTVSATDNATSDVVSIEEDQSIEQITLENIACGVGTDINRDIISEDNQKEDLNITINYPDEIVKNPSSPTISLNNVPNDYKIGLYDVYIDGVFDKTIDYNGINENHEMEPNIEGLNIGEHIISINLSGNAKYNPINLTHKFAILESMIFIPDEIVAGISSTVSVTAVKGATGYFIVNVDGKLFSKVQLTSKSQISTASIDLSSLSLGSHEVEAIYEGDNIYKKNTLKKTVISTFEMSIEPYLYEYGYENNRLEIYLPNDCINVPVVTINGKKYNVTEYDGHYRANLQYAPLGTFDVSITYHSDKKYPERTIFETYSIFPQIHIYENDVVYDAGVSLRLPEDAAGNLTVYVNKEIYKSVQLNNGEALIPLDLPIGVYSITATYSGDDCSIENATNEYYEMKPKFTYESEMTYGEKQTIYIRMNPNSTGTLTYLDKNTRLNFTNGTANITVDTEKTIFEWIDDSVFNHHEFLYEDERGYSRTYGISIYVHPIASRFTNANDITMYYGSVGTFSLKVWGNYGTPVGTNNQKYEWTNIDIQIGPDKYEAYVNNKGIASIKFGSEKIYMKFDPKSNGYNPVKIKLLPGTYKITVIYGSTNITKTLHVKQPLSLKAVNVKRSAKKIVLQATLKNGKTPMKNKAITFKFNGKTYKTKTNSMGIAKVIIKSTVLKKLKAGKKVTYQATYGKDTVKKTVKIKK